MPKIVLNSSSTLCLFFLIIVFLNKNDLLKLPNFLPFLFFVDAPKRTNYHHIKQRSQISKLLAKLKHAFYYHNSFKNLCYFLSPFWNLKWSNINIVNNFCSFALINQLNFKHYVLFRIFTQLINLQHNTFVLVHGGFIGENT